MGLARLRIAATPPASIVVPDISPASISTWPARVRTLPEPALRARLSSIVRTAARTASSDEPPSASTCQPISAARRQPVRWASFSSEGIAHAPQCTMIAGRGEGGLSMRGHPGGG